MIETFLGMQRSENTKRAYRQDITRWFDFLDGREPTEALALAWKDDLEASLSSNSALRAFVTVRAYYKWLDEDNSPFRRIKAPRRLSNWTPTAPDPRDVDALIGICTDTRDRAIIALLNNGLRAQEVCDLSLDDLKYETAYHTWVLRVTGKGQKLRFVPLNQDTVRVMEQYHGADGSRIFPNLNIRVIYYIVEKWSKAAGIDRINPHALRHGFATKHIRAGTSVFHVQKLLGHTRADTTSVYVNLDLSDLVEATRNIEPPTEERMLRAV